MGTVVIVLGHGELIFDKIPESADIIGVDAGAAVCAKNNLHMKKAIGDFDSVTKVEFEHIQMMSDELVLLNKDKDDSDFEAALKHVEAYDDVIVFGSWGKRFDHSYVNLELVKRNSKITFYDYNNKVYSLPMGEYDIVKGDYTYLSLFAIEDTSVSLTGVKYELDNRLLAMSDLYALSNEIIDEVAHLNIHSGKLLIIQSKD